MSKESSILWSLNYSYWWSSFGISYVSWPKTKKKIYDRYSTVHGRVDSRQALKSRSFSLIDSLFDFGARVLITWIVNKAMRAGGYFAIILLTSSLPSNNMAHSQANRIINKPPRKAQGTCFTYLAYFTWLVIGKRPQGIEKQSQWPVRTSVRLKNF